jgi:carboxylesterase type B
MAIRSLLAAVLLAARSLAQDGSDASTLGGGGGGSSLQVDLGYGVYKGVSNSSSGLNTWKGVRYAAPPVGPQRWRAPAPPAINRTVVIANTFGPTCPQSALAGVGVPFTPGNEDCLFLNVYAPAGKSGKSSGVAMGMALTDRSLQGLPVFIYIHGGGYGLGDGTQDMSAFINSNDKRFIAITIQYRVCQPASSSTALK